MRIPVRVTQGVALTSGALTVATGLLHDAMVYTQMDNVQSLSQSYRQGFAWLFLCTGTAVAFAGGLNMSAARGLIRGEQWARRLTLASSVFLLVLGGAGLALDEWGAAALAAFGLISLLPWWLTRRVGAPQLSEGSPLPAKHSASSPHPSVGR